MDIVTASERPPLRADEAPAIAEAIEAILATISDRRGALLPLLHALQDAFGHIDDAMVPHVAAALNLSRADVHGVATFYHDFRRQPAARHVVRLCRAESCQARGGAAIERAAIDRLGRGNGRDARRWPGQSRPGLCLGLCATGPNALVDGVPVSRIDSATLDRIAVQVGA